MSADGATRRVNRGRGHTYLLDGERADGVTWVKSNGVPAPALINWAGEVTARYALDHWDELAELAPSKRLAQLERARFDVRDTAAIRGTNVHKLAQRLYAGEEVDVPEELTGHVDAYLAFLTDWDPVELYVETPVFSRQWGYAGTPDMIAELVDGRVWLLDWKTAAKGIFREDALQLAAYRYADFLLDEGREMPIPPIEATACVWLRADGYDLVPVTADERTFSVFLHALHVARFVDSPRESWVGDVIPPLKVKS